MRPTSKDPYGRPGQPGQGQNRPGYGQQPGRGQNRPAYGQQPDHRTGYGQQPAAEQRQQPSPAQRPTNIKGDVIWALRNAGGGMSVFDISSKITAAGKPRYGETKILNILELLVKDNKVTMSDETGRVTYKWTVEEF